MVMADRSEVATSSAPITALTVGGLVQNLANAAVSVPFRNPFRGHSGPVQNLGASVTRQVVRSFMGFSTSLQIEEFRAMERVLDDVCRVLLPPLVARRRRVAIEPGEEGGVPGLWIRPREGRADATLLYLHGGGYIGTAPSMYVAFVGALARGTGCEVFIADYRLAPEFPYPAGLHDAVAAYRSLVDGGRSPDRIVVAGDSGGGGLACSTVVELAASDLPTPAGLVLFSPEVALEFTGSSIVDNARRDILPWNLPSAPYLHGVRADDARVSAVYADPSLFPPTFVSWGDDEMFRDGIARFVDHLRSGGAPVTAVEEPGMFHVFPILMPWSEAARRTYRAADRFIDEALGLVDAPSVATA
jgi:epsilon-lactone hydrolase